MCFFASRPPPFILSSFPSPFPSSSLLPSPLLLSFPSPLPSSFRSCNLQNISTPIHVPVSASSLFAYPPHPHSRPRSHLALHSWPPLQFSFPFRFCPHHRPRSRSHPRPRSRLHSRPRFRSCPRHCALFPVSQTQLPLRYDARIQTPVCACVSECSVYVYLVAHDRAIRP